MSENWSAQRFRSTLGILAILGILRKTPSKHIFYAKKKSEIKENIGIRLLHGRNYRTYGSTVGTKPTKKLFWKEVSF